MRSAASSQLPTEMTRCPQASELTEERSTFERCGEVRGEAPGVHLADASERPRVVALDPRVEATVADFDAPEADQPGAGLDADDRRSLRRGLRMIEIRFAPLATLYRSL